MRKLRKPLRKRARKHIDTPHIGAAALRSIYALRDPRRLKHLRMLFQRPIFGAIKGHAWLPRAWWARAGKIFAAARTHTLRIHRGRRWRRLFVGRWNVGFAWGSFSRSQALAVFKKKASKKKRARRQNIQAVPGLGLRIQHIKDVKAGLRRKSSLRYDPTVEAQLRGLVL